MISLVHFLKLRIRFPTAKINPPAAEKTRKPLGFTDSNVIPKGLEVVNVAGQIKPCKKEPVEEKIPVVYLDGEPAE